MWLKKCCGALLVCSVMAGCLGITAGAVEVQYDHYIIPDTVELVDMNDSAVSRASGALNTTVSANSTAADKNSFYLDALESVTINCSYTPTSASMDFGLVAADGTFYYLNVTNGSINKTIQVPERGYYTLAIRNNASYSVSVTGYVNY